MIMKYKSIAFITVLIIIAVLIFYPKPNIADPNYTYVIPPVHGVIIIIGDYIYFISSDDTLKKYNKSTLTEYDSFEIPDCHYGVIYSSYLDKLIVKGGNDPFYIKMIDYNNMTVVDEYSFDRGQIGDFKATGNKLYIAWDNSGYEVGDPYNTETLPKNTGVLSEYDIDTMTENWSVNVGTFPTGINLAGDYIIVSAEEQGDDAIGGVYPYVLGSMVSVVNRITRDVYHFPAGYGRTVPSAYDGDDTFYIANIWGAFYINQYGGTDEIEMGMTILDLPSMAAEHFTFDTAETIDRLTCVSHAAYEDGLLYLTYYDSIYDGSAYFGKFNTVTKDLENVEMSGLEQFLIYVVKDNNNLFFVSTEGWLIKYTMD